jgi:oligopeptide/dipeptide ABC transporter ATP-binding protein
MATLDPSVQVDGQADAERHSGHVLRVVGLSKTFPGPRVRGSKRRASIRAVRSVSFETLPGGVLGIVGETGSGKSTLVRCIAGLTSPSEGKVFWDGVELTVLSREGWRLTRRDLQVVLQNPYSTLDPGMSILSIVREPLDNFGIGESKERSDVVREVLKTVGLGAVELRTRPAQLSGGQRQRVALARALVLEPDLLVLDEPVSALDVSIQAQVLNLLQRLRREQGLSYVVVLHDLAVARQLCDTILVMYAGRIVESGEVTAVLAHPAHPYTRALIAASPDIGRETAGRLTPVHGPGRGAAELVPSDGCRYRTRCSLSNGAAMCAASDPELLEFGPGQSVACHLAWPAEGSTQPPAADEAGQVQSNSSGSVQDD